MAWHRVYISLVDAFVPHNVASPQQEHWQLLREHSSGLSPHRIMIISAFDETLAAAASAPTHVPIAPHLRRVNIVDVPSPLLLCQDGGEPLRLYIHPDVPMRNHILSQLHVSALCTGSEALAEVAPPVAVAKCSKMIWNEDGSPVRTSRWTSL